MKEQIQRGLVGLMVVASAAACQPEELIESGSGVTGVAPVVAVKNGQAVVAWHRSNDVRVSEYEEGATWSTPLVLGTGQFPEVAASDSESAIVVWGGGGSLRASLRSAAGWSAPQTLASLNGHDYAVAQEAAGRAVVVWSNGTSVRARTRSGASWEATVVLRNAPAVGRPQVAVNDAGVVFAAWCDSAGAMWGARRVHPGAWEGATNSMPGCCQAPAQDTPGPSVSVGVDASGAAQLVGGNASRVCQKRYIPGLGWEGTFTLGTPGPEATAPQLAVNPNGQALLAWVHHVGEPMKVRAYEPGGGPGVGWGPELVGPQPGTGRLGVGIGSTGNGAIVYRSGGPSISAVGYNGSLTAPTEVGTAPSGGAYNLRVGYDSSEPSQGVSVWQLSTGEQVWASRLGL